MARVCEQAERFQDMVEYLKPLIVQKGPHLDVEQRTLISVAFKNLIAPLRIAIKTTQAILARYSDRFYQMPEKTSQALQMELPIYKARLQEDLYNNCEELVNLIKTYILTEKPTDEARAFFEKMIGDYCRYVAESEQIGFNFDNIDNLQKDIED